MEKVQRRAARFVSKNFRCKASVSEMLHNLGWQTLDSRRQDQRLFFSTKLLKGSRRLKRRTSSRQPTPGQGRITASNSNTSRQIVIHIDFLFFQPLFRAGTTFHLDNHCYPYIDNQGYPSLAYCNKFEVWCLYLPPTYWRIEGGPRGPCPPPPKIG